MLETAKHDTTQLANDWRNHGNRLLYEKNKHIFV